MRNNILWIILFLLGCLAGRGQVSIPAGRLLIGLDKTGRFVSLTDTAGKKNFHPAGTDSPLLRIRVNGNWETPVQATYNGKRNLLKILFLPSGTTASVGILTKPTHTVFEVLSIDPPGNAEAVAWGPVSLSISQNIGEIIGVVHDSTFAIGLQVLNVKTLGGEMLNDEGSDPTRSNTAKAAPFGCTLQAFTMDRTRPRKVSGWWGQFPDMPVAPIPGEGLEHSRIALFGCRAGEVLQTIGKIEVAEKLPHPMIDGIWAKESPEYGRSYLIADYDEKTIDELLQYTKRAGLMSLYHMYPWVSWGHYELSPEAFPNGAEGFRQCAARALAMGIRLGAHTLSDFINTNDPYVTPVPDRRLAITGSSILTRDIGTADTVICVESPVYFANEKANWLHTVRIGDELIRYRSVSQTSPWTLNGCTRGAFGTGTSSHHSGEQVGKLLDHPYQVFFPDFNLLQEIAVNMAHRFNELGLQQMDFDGFEGCLSAGQGDYGLEVFAKTFYDHLDHTVINGPSISEPFYWHICTYCNWGEPWYGGFTQSMQQYRIDNQGLFERNYLPHMLGWYLLTDSTTMAEMEWMLARAAGYNAGFAMATSLEALRNNPDAGGLLDAIRDWEYCRREGAFPPALREQLKDPENEFHLERQSDTLYLLYPVVRIPDSDPVRYTHGEPVQVSLQ
jgi:hypothetical protein